MIGLLTLAFMVVYFALGLIVLGRIYNDLPQRWRANKVYFILGFILWPQLVWWHVSK